MPFALRLQDSLRDRHGQVAKEFAAGESLETVLGRHLLAIEAAADTELLTSILLLDESGKHVLHGAAPNLPKSYCEAIHGAEIGPQAGSCGTAAYTGRAIYVTDIATDPLWNEYRHLALPHGLRACWSTPIRSPAEKVIGTFAVYHLTPRSPTPAEVESIQFITDHVSRAIMWSRSRDGEARTSGSGRLRLRLVSDHVRADIFGDNVETGPADRFLDYATKLDRYAEMVTSRSFAAALKATADECRRLGDRARDGQKSLKDDMPS